MGNFQPHEFVVRGSKTQLQVGEKLNKLTNERSIIKKVNQFWVRVLEMQTLFLCIHVNYKNM